MSVAELLLVALLAVVLAITTTTANAGNVPKSQSLFISVMAGEQYFDSTAALTDDRYASAGVGYRLGDRHSVEMVAGRSDTTTVPGGLSANADTRRIDMLWHYFRGTPWQPYVLSGFGQDEYTSAGSDTRGTFATGGAGIFRHVIGPFLLRAEVRALYSFDRNAWHGVAAMGLTCAFGGDYLGPPTLPVPKN